MGQLSSCFILHDTLTDTQARLLYELGPNNFYINWLDIVELSELRGKMLLHYDAKCVKDLTCVDLSASRGGVTTTAVATAAMSGKFTGAVVTCSNFKESLNAIGSVQVLFPLLNYLATSGEYAELVANDWMASARLNAADRAAMTPFQQLTAFRKSSFDG
jgi:hypothetical protein